MYYQIKVIFKKIHPGHIMFNILNSKPNFKLQSKSKSRLPKNSKI